MFEAINSFEVLCILQEVFVACLYRLLRFPRILFLQ